MAAARLVKIEDYRSSHHAEVVELITGIQQREFGVPITYEDQPDLIDINGFFCKFWVATISDKPVGTIGMKMIGDFAVIRKMFVVEEYRGKDLAIAQLLLVRLEEEAALNKINKIYLGSAELLKRAHRFYEKNGYDAITTDDLPREFPVMKIDTKFYTKNL